MTADVTLTVTVAGGKFLIDGVSQATVDVSKCITYRFDQSDSSNSGHPLRLSLTSNGTHAGGSEYTERVTISGTPGSSGAYTEIEISAKRDIYYYCSNHSNMGGVVRFNFQNILNYPRKFLSNNEIRNLLRTDDYGSLLPLSAINVAETHAITTATITYTASATATSYGVYYSTSPGVTTSDTLISGGASSTSLTGLSANTTYYVRVAMTNSNGTTLTESDISFTTYPSGTTILNAGTTTTYTASMNNFAVVALPVGKSVEIHVSGGGGGGGGHWNHSGVAGAQGGKAALSFTSNGEILKYTVGGGGTASGGNSVNAYQQAGGGGGASAVLLNSNNSPIIVAGGGGGASSAWNNAPTSPGAGGVVTSGNNKADGGVPSPNYDNQTSAATDGVPGSNSRNSNIDGYGTEGGYGVGQNSDNPNNHGDGSVSGWGQGGGTGGSYYGTGGGGGGGYKGGAGGVYWQSGGGGSSYIDNAYTSITSSATPGSGGAGGASYGSKGSAGTAGQVKFIIGS